MTHPQDPKKVAAQAAMMKFLAQKPEPLLAMLDRFGIPWERKTVDDVPSFVIKWTDFMEAERQLQTQPTLLETMAKEINAEFGPIIQAGLG